MIRIKATRNQRRLAAIMFSNIVGYTALMGRSEQLALRARERHRALLGQLSAGYGGRIVDENGDELVLVFDGSLDAVKGRELVERVRELESLRRVREGGSRDRGGLPPPGPRGSTPGDG